MPPDVLAAEWETTPLLAVGEDEVRLHGVRLECVVGFSDHERDVLQPVDVDLVLRTTPPAGGYTDDPTAVVDYKRLKDDLRVGTLGARFLTLEALAEHVARRCLAPPGVRGVRVTAHKPGALTGAADVAVRITRVHA